MSLYEQTRKEFVELLRIKSKLTKYIIALDKEIMKTDVEWMNLRDLSKNLDKADEVPPQNGSTKNKEAVPLEATQPVLDLNPNRNHQSVDEEFDSDSE